MSGEPVLLAYTSSGLQHLSRAEEDRSWKRHHHLNKRQHWRFTSFRILRAPLLALPCICTAAPIFRGLSFPVRFVWHLFPAQSGLSVNCGPNFMEVKWILSTNKIHIRCVVLDGVGKRV